MGKQNRKTWWINICFGSLIILMSLSWKSWAQTLPVFDQTGSMQVVAQHSEDIQRVIWHIATQSGGPYRQINSLPGELGISFAEANILPQQEQRVITYRIVGTKQGNPQVPIEIQMTYGVDDAPQTYYVRAEAVLHTGGSVTSDEVGFIVQHYDPSENAPTNP